MFSEKLFLFSAEMAFDFELLLEQAIVTKRIAIIPPNFLILFFHCMRFYFKLRCKGTTKL